MHAVVSMQICKWELVGVQREAHKHARGNMQVCKWELTGVPMGACGCANGGSWVCKWELVGVQWGAQKHEGGACGCANGSPRVCKRQHTSKGEHAGVQMGACVPMGVCGYVDGSWVCKWENTSMQGGARGCANGITRVQMWGDRCANESTKQAHEHVGVEMGACRGANGKP